MIRHLKLTDDNNIFGDSFSWCLYGGGSVRIDDSLTQRAPRTRWLTAILDAHDAVAMLDKKYEKTWTAKTTQLHMEL